MTDFRKIEHELCRFFASRGAMPTCAGGNVYVGWASTESTTKTAKNEHSANPKSYLLVHVDVRVHEDPETSVICLTDLARELADFIYIQERTK